MRLFLITVLLATFVCSSFGQESSDFYQRPANPITSFFKNLFGMRRPEVTDPLTNADFDSSLPRGSSDRMINGALEQRILEESSEQQRTQVGSPFIRPSNDEPETTTADDQKSLNYGTFSSSREGYGKGVASDAIPISEALRIVSTSNLTDCVARVICELSCNANAFGTQGRVVFRNLIKLQFDNSIKSDDAKFFRQAAAKGRQIVQSKKDCNQCYAIYPTCKSNSEDLVAVSAMFKL